MLPLVVCIVITIGNTYQNSSTDNPIEVCFLWRNNVDSRVQLRAGSLELMIFWIGSSCGGAFMIGFHSILIWKRDRILVSTWVREGIPPWILTICFGVSLLLSLVPNAFKIHQFLGYIASGLLMCWSFCIQMFLQPESDIGLFSCTASITVTILSSLVQCEVDSLDELTAAICGFSLVLGLYYLYLNTINNPTKDEVHISTEDVDVHSLLSLVGNWEVIRRAPNMHYYIKPTKDNKSTQLVPTSAVDEYIRERLATQGGNYTYLRKVYTFKKQKKQVEECSRGSEISRRSMEGRE